MEENRVKKYIVERGGGVGGKYCGKKLKIRGKLEEKLIMQRRRRVGERRIMKEGRRIKGKRRM